MAMVRTDFRLEWDVLDRRGEGSRSEVGQHAASDAACSVSLVHRTQHPAVPTLGSANPCRRSVFDTDNIDIGPERRQYLDHALRWAVALLASWVGLGRHAWLAAVWSCSSA